MPRITQGFRRRPVVKARNQEGQESGGPGIRRARNQEGQESGGPGIRRARNQKGQEGQEG
jgi:hypothetical protein